MAVCDYANRECGYWDPVEADCEALFIDQCPAAMARILMARPETASGPSRPDPAEGTNAPGDRPLA